MRPRRATIKVKVNERDVLSACMDILQMKRIFFYRQNSGALKTESGGFVRFGTPGAPDIVLIVGGQYVGLEVKSSVDKQSESQRIFQAGLEEAGGLYWLVSDPQQLIEKLKTIYP